MKEWVFPASYAQERVWLSNQLDPDSPVYNITGLVPLPDGVTDEMVRAALAEVIDRHEAMRTRLRMADGVLTQVVAESVPNRLDELDLADGPDLDARLAEATAELAGAAIAMDDLPLWRAWLVRVDGRCRSVLIVGHHAIFDNRSIGVFWLDLVALCEAAVAGAPSPLAPLPIQYPDFSVWQRDQVAAELDQELAFWRAHLADAPQVLTLPTDRPRPARLGFEGGHVDFTLPDGLVDQVTELGRRHSATPQMVFLAAFSVLLSRLGTVDDLIIGVSTAGRDRADLRDLIGMFVNPVPVRVELSGAPTFAQLVDRVRDRMLDVMDHWSTPFQCIVDAMVPQRDPAVQPLFQVSMNYIQTGFEETPLGTTKDDLALDLTASACRLLYRTALFDRATIQSIVDRFVLLLTAAADPTTPIGELPLLTDAERADLLHRWAGDATTAERGTVVDLVEAAVAAAPSASALVCAGTTLTYAELNARANGLARSLVSRGIGPESLVALALPRHVDQVVAVLAVLKAGGAYLPIDAAWPLDRTARTLADSGADLVLSTSDSQLPQGVPVVALDTAAAAGDDANLTDADRVAPVRPEHAAYVLYTSGSTGRPKGVVVEHRSAHAYLTWAVAAYPGLAGTALLHSPLSFDLSVTALLGTLAAGGTVRLAGIDEQAARDGGRPTFVKATPGHLPLLDAQLSPTADLVVGGEALTAEALREWRERNPTVTVVNEYGPTEATVGTVAAAIAPGQELPPGPVTIGTPAPGVACFLLDAQLRPVPQGVLGEVYLAGDQLARGYLGAPARTAERFVACPYIPGARMYRTGDLASWRRDGTISYAGRADRQVKIRGMRVELDEITAVLLDQPGVAEAVTVLADDQTLVGYLVGSADHGDLAAALGQVLPAHMVPSQFVTVAAMPLSGNGKLDLAALPKPVASAESEFVAPRTDAEEVVAEVFAEILKLDKVGALDNFIQLGGNSLRGMRAVAKLRAELEIDLPMRAIFSHPVVADLAGEVERLIAAEVAELSDAEVAELLEERP